MSGPARHFWSAQLRLLSGLAHTGGPAQPPHGLTSDLWGSQHIPSGLSCSVGGATSGRISLCQNRAVALRQRRKEGRAEGERTRIRLRFDLVSAGAKLVADPVPAPVLTSQARTHMHSASPRVHRAKKTEMRRMQDRVGRRQG